MLTTKTWDDYLTESSSAKDPPGLPSPGYGTRAKSSNPFRNIDADDADRDDNATDHSFNAISSDILDNPVNENEIALNENGLLRNTTDKNTLESFDSLDIYQYREAKARPRSERFLLFDGEEVAPASSPTPLKDIFDNHVREDIKSASLYCFNMKHKKRQKVFGEPKVFGGNFKYMKGYLKSALPSSEVEKENNCSSTETSTSNDVMLDTIVVKLQQELKSCRRKIERLRDMNMNCVRRKDELQEEVLVTYKDITDLKIALQTSCDKQHEFEIEMRIAKARVDEAEREAAIAIGQGNKFEKELEEVDRKQHSTKDKLTSAEQKVNSLAVELSTYKEKYRQEVESKHHFQQQAETRNFELKACRKEIESLKVKLKETEDEKSSQIQNVEKILQEKARCEGQIEELTKSNTSIKEDYGKLQSLHDLCKQNAETSHRRVLEQKEKFEAMVGSRVHIEMEIKEIHDDLARHKKEKEELAAECNRLLECLNERETTSEQLKKDNEQLKRDNSSMKDKILYLELYKKIIDTKSLTLDELKPLQSKILEQSSKTRLVDEEEENNDNDKENHKTFSPRTPRNDKAPKTLDVDLRSISKKLDDIKEEHRLTHNKSVDRISPKVSTITNQYTNKEEQTTLSSQSPRFEMSINDSKSSIFPTFIMSRREGSFSNSNNNLYSDLIEADNRNIANALL